MNNLQADTHSTEKSKYLQPAPHDCLWGVAITTIGRRRISANKNYPLDTQPVKYNFQADGKRVLNEYQLVYITRGAGYFESKSFPRKRIQAGSIFMLFPGEWHAYYPDQSTGWDEYWVGFNGQSINNLIANGFFTYKQPIFNAGADNHIIDSYNEIYHIVSEGKSRHQQLAAGILMDILGRIYYIAENNSFAESFISQKINQAKAIIKEELGGEKSLEEIAKELNISYSMFRREFKLQCGISPGQYCQEQKLIKAKLLLRSTNLSMSQIAEELHFDSLGQFSTFFRKRIGIPPLEYRKRITHEAAYYNEDYTTNQ